MFFGNIRITVTFFLYIDILIFLFIFKTCHRAGFSIDSASFLFAFARCRHAVIFWIGFLAAVMADGLLWGAAAWVVTCEPGLVQVVTPEVLLLVSGVLLVLGVLITTVCALLSINKYLRMKASTLYAV